MYKRCFILSGGLVAALWLPSGCNAIRNGWLDPTVLGDFAHTRTNEIRPTLSLEDMPIGIVGAGDPTQEDLEIQVREYPISAGDVLRVQIDQLLQRDMFYGDQLTVDETGLLNLPVVGRIVAAGLTVLEFEDELVEVLRDRQILKHPEVTVSALLLRESMYQLYGIGVSASSTAQLRAGSYPVGRPNLKILEAVNLVGGLSEFVTEIYVFRYDQPQEQVVPVPEGVIEPEAVEPSDVEPPAQPGRTEPTEAPANEADKPGEAPDPDARAKEELIEAVTLQDDEPPPVQEQVPPELEVPPTQQWIWHNDEFVKNPAYEGGEETPKVAPRPPLPGPRDRIAPGVNWATISGESTYRTIRIAADSLRSGDPESNIYVRGGDTIRIVSGEIGVYYVMGQVARVGPFGFNAEPITLKSAIATAGGLTGLAWPSRCTVYRRLGQREQMIQVDLDAIFAGEQEDFFIRRGDIINVGTHPIAPFLQRIRAFTLPNPAATLGYSFTYARNFADIDSFGARANPNNQPRLFPNLFP